MTNTRNKNYKSKQQSPVSACPLSHLYPLAPPAGSIGTGARHLLPTGAGVSHSCTSAHLPRFLEISLSTRYFGAFFDHFSDVSFLVTLYFNRMHRPSGSLYHQCLTICECCRASYRRSTSGTPIGLIPPSSNPSLREG